LKALEEYIESGEGNENKILRTVGIGFYNSAVQYEFILDFKSAIRNYKRGLKFSNIHLGKESALSHKFQQGLEAIHNKIEVIIIYEI
jgi:hypothetical protein